MMQLRLDQVGNANNKSGKGKKRTGELHLGYKSKQEMQFYEAGEEMDAGTELRDPSRHNIASKNNSEMVASGSYD